MFTILFKQKTTITITTITIITTTTITTTTITTTTITTTITTNNNTKFPFFGPKISLFE